MGNNGLYLYTFSKKAQFYDEEKINDLMNLFNRFLGSCSGLENNAFKNEKGKFVISHFDAIFVAVCSLIRDNGLINMNLSFDSLVALRQNSEFIKASQEKTAANASVKKRIQKVKEIIVLQ